MENVLSILQNVFRFIGDLKYPVILVTLILNNESCSKVLFYENFLDKTCISLAISKTLSYLMMLGSCFYKVPIIIKIVNLKGGDGLNIVSMYLETSSYLAALFYNIFRGSPFSTYGDYLAPIIQNLIIIILIWIWGMNKKPFSSSHIILVLLTTSCFIAGVFMVPVTLQSFIMSYSIGILMLSRIPQIISNFTTGTVGVQSPITLVNGVIGAAAKTFIIFVEANDFYLLAGSMISLTFNVTLLSQIIYLQSIEKTKKKKV